MRAWLRLNILAAMVLLPLMAFAASDNPSAGGADAISRFMPDTTTKSYRHIEATKSLTIHRDTLRARRIWREIVAEDSTYSPALYNLSRVELQHRRVNLAERAYRADSTNKWYVHNYAAQLIVARNYREAIPIYRQLMRLDPHNIEAYHTLAILYITGGMPYSAIATLDSAEIHIGYNPYLSSMKQDMLLETRQYDKAIEAGCKVVEELPYDSKARTSLAMAYEASGQDSLAQHHYEAALLIDSTDLKTIKAIVDYYGRRGDIRRMFDYEERVLRDRRVAVEEKLNRLKNYTSNVEFYGQNYIRIGGIIRLLAIDYPENRDIIEAYTSHLLAIGEQEAALNYLREHLDDSTATDSDYVTTLQLANYLQREEIVAEVLNKGLSRFQRSVELHAFAAFVASEKGETKEAISLLNKALDECDDVQKQSELWGYIGDIEHGAGNDRAAFKAYDRALRLNSDNVLVLNNYAYFLSLLDKELERALAMAKQAITLEKSNATYIDTYAWVLHRLGRNEEAKASMRQALSLSRQRDPDLLAHYADILWALGEKFMAETYWKKAVEMGYDSDEMERHIESITGAKRE